MGLPVRQVDLLFFFFFFFLVHMSRLGRRLVVVAASPTDLPVHTPVPALKPAALA
jgi:hypothetical protein